MLQIEYLLKNIDIRGILEILMYNLINSEYSNTSAFWYAIFGSVDTMYVEIGALIYTNISVIFKDELYSE